jgi:hypothetical protein
MNAKKNRNRNTLKHFTLKENTILMNPAYGFNISATDSDSKLIDIISKYN